MEAGEDGPVERCRAAVEELRARHGWHLLDPEEFARRTDHRLAQAGAGDPRVAALAVYSAALYHACSGAEGPARQEQAIGELWRYLCSVACWRYPGLGQGAVQAVLEQVGATIERCPSPIAFLAFALQALVDLARRQIAAGLQPAPLAAARLAPQSCPSAPEAARAAR